MDTQLVDFLGIVVVGAVLSGIIEWIKAKFGTASMTNRWLTILLSIVVGGLYFWLRSTVWWETILGVLAASSTVYALFIKKATP